MIFPGALGTVIGARLGHVFFYNFDKFWADPWWLFRVWEGGLASHGATIGLFIALFIYAAIYRQSFLECLDRFAFSAALGSILVRVANFINSEIVGRVTDQTWGVRFPRHDWNLPPAQVPLRHPSQFYEALMGLMVMGILVWLDRRFGREKRPRGLLTGAFFASYFTGRFVVEFFKERHVLNYSIPLSMGQFLSIIPAVCGFVIIYFSLKKRVPAHWRVAEQKPENNGSDKAGSGRGKKKKSKRKSSR